MKKAKKVFIEEDHEIGPAELDASRAGGSNYIHQALSSCKEILSSKLIQAPDADQLEKEFNGGEYHKKAQQIALTCNVSADDDFYDDEPIDAKLICSCKNEGCEDRTNCNLQFLYQQRCVWLSIAAYINSPKALGTIIFAISKYMERSEEETENKFTF